MDKKTGRADHIEDYLVTVRTGPWFGWTNSKNKVYANLVVLDSGAKPSEADVNAGLKAMQDEWDIENATYRVNRKAEYPTLREQFDLLYKDIVANKVDTTGEFAKAIKSVKDKYPK